MGTLSKADFYYGALLSELISSGFCPAIFEQGETRRIYSFENDHGDYQIFAKYSSKPSPSQRKDIQVWHFSFSTDELQKIRTYEDGKKKHYFALICGRSELKGSELALLSLEDVKDCLGMDYPSCAYRITIKFERGKKGLGAYGTGRADKDIDGRNNMRKVSRDLTSFFQEDKSLISVT
ncbi:hypothetical protein P4V41_10885 [Fictibacillus nanhaiensis]|uniref:hypothetical protein n=1 Tax=Fictibacillus nanhaiensis TaxID=742169 RepID=UPI002E208B7B|nr:hypothetical protein [Fictibacillus nanhaiensis]